MRENSTPLGDGIKLEVEKTRKTGKRAKLVNRETPNETGGNRTRQIGFGGLCVKKGVTRGSGADR